MLWPVYELLMADAVTVAIVSDRVYEDVAPQETQAVDSATGREPYVVWQTIGGGMQNYLSERPGIDNARVQLDCYAETKTVVRNLAVAVRDAIELHAHQIGQPRTEYIHAVKLFRVSMDFSFWVNRTVGSP